MRPRRLKNEINVVPYIDVMLVLLVIFMVAAPMMQTGAVDLPIVGNTNLPPYAPLRIEVHASGQLKIVGADGKTKNISQKELEALFVTEREKNMDTPVVISGDKAARYESVLFALDAAKSAGFTKVALETGRKESQRP